MKLSIIIPCYNEAATIEAVVTRIQKVNLPTGWDKEIIIVDDGSNTETHAAIDRISTAFPVHVLFRKTNGGKGRAVKDGLSKATGEYLVIQDGDMEYDPNDYSRLLVPILAGEADVTFGSRNLSDNNSAGRALYFWGGQLVTLCFNVAFGTKLSDLTTCYKLFPRSMVPALVAQPSDDFVFDAIELSYVLTRSKVLEIPIRYEARTTAQGKKLRPIHGVRCVERIIELKLGESFFRVVKFITVGGIAAVVNLAVLYMLTSVVGVWYLASSVISFIVALLTNFYLQKAWAFRANAVTLPRQLSLFIGINLINLGLNTILVYLFVSDLGVHYLLAQVCASVLISFESFFVYRFIFKRT